VRLRTGVWPLFAALVVGAGLSAPGAFAAPFDVNDVSDAHDVNPGDGVCNVVIEGGGVLCTLRAAVEEANALAGADEVKVPAGDYNLKIDQGGAIEITSDLIIGGAGARSTVIRQERDDRAGIGDRVFDIQGVDPPPAVTISDVTIADGRAQDALGFFGGNIRSTGDLRLVDSTITGGRASSGGGIANVGGTLLVEDSTISFNSAPDGGGDSGAIQNFEDALIGTASLAVRNSTISGNSARLGGGIFNWSNSNSPVGNTISITNSTITGNSSGDRGGAGGLALASNATATVTNTIISGNASQELLLNCSADAGSAITSLGNNIENARDCAFTASGDLQSTDPVLGELVNNGGGTDTHALGAGSPAIDAADDAACPTADQRGILRPQGRSCDIGAFELELPPETTITSGPTGPTNDATPTFAFTSSEPGTFQCRLDAASFVACSSPFTTATLTDGPHTFEVRAIDTANNADPTPAARAFTVDPPSPDTAITSGPAGPTNDPTPTFSFSSPDGTASFECRVDGGPFGACTPPHTTGTLSEASHTFEVRAKDPVGNVDPTPASRSFTVDTLAPAAPSGLASAPASPANHNSPVITGSAEPGSTVRLYTNATCTSALAGTATASGAGSFSITVTVASDSTTSFRATATDPAGNVSGCSSSSVTYVEDSTPPDTAIASGPSGPTNDPTPTFSFSSPDGTASFECRVDGGPFGACSSPFTTGTLTDAPHTFEVRAVDAAQNTDPSPAARAFTVETQPPDTTITSGPAGLTNDATPTFAFSSSEPGTFQCRVDAAQFVACSSPFTTGTLTDGSHTFEVRAIDTANNADPSPAARNWTIVQTPPPDTTPPDTPITSGPPASGLDSTPTFVFGSTEPASRFECSLDGGAFVACTSPFTTGRLAVGRHTLAVRAIDASGNVDPTPSVYVFEIEATTVAQLPDPQLGVDFNVQEVAGQVLVGIRAGAARATRGGAKASQKGIQFVPLSQARQIPVGSFLDTRRGTVRLQSARNRAGARQTGDFAGSIFQVKQSRQRRARGLTDLVLKGGNFRRCASGRRGKGASAAASRTIRRHRGSASGRFRTSARNSSATVRGTVWEVRDRCDGTLTTVRRGRVLVRDFRRKRNILLTAGKSYLARAPR
jgi:hypothetical protein